MNADIAERILVVGTGTMGAGIAQVAATAGATVFLYDQNPSAASEARERIAASLERAAAKGHVAQETIGPAIERLLPSNSLEPAAEADAVIEAVREDLEVKRAVFQQLEGASKPETLLWTNTSMISISRIAQSLRHPGRVAGTHFFNPVPRMKLVEIIAGAATEERTVRVAEETVKAWGKIPVRAPDSPGFIVNRILDAIKREALALLDEGVAPDRIDAGVRLGLNFPMGPFELMDLVGLNTTHDCLIAQAKAMGRPAEFSPLLRRLVEEGNWGRKTGKGFYCYGGGEGKPGGEARRD